MFFRRRCNFVTSSAFHRLRFPIRFQDVCPLPGCSFGRLKKTTGRGLAVGKGDVFFCFMGSLLFYGLFLAKARSFGVIWGCRGGLRVQGLRGIAPDLVSLGFLCCKNQSSVAKWAARFGVGPTGRVKPRQNPTPLGGRSFAPDVF